MHCKKNKWLISNNGLQPYTDSAEFVERYQLVTIHPNKSWGVKDVVTDTILQTYTCIDWSVISDHYHNTFNLKIEMNNRLFYWIQLSHEGVSKPINITKPIHWDSFCRDYFFDNCYHIVNDMKILTITSQGDRLYRKVSVSTYVTYFFYHFSVSVADIRLVYTIITSYN